MRPPLQPWVGSEGTKRRTPSPRGATAAEAAALLGEGSVAEEEYEPGGPEVLAAMPPGRLHPPRFAGPGVREVPPTISPKDYAIAVSDLSILPTRTPPPAGTPYSFAF